MYVLSPVFAESDRNHSISPYILVFLQFQSCAVSTFLSAPKKKISRTVVVIEVGFESLELE